MVGGGGNSSFSTSLAILIPKSLVCTHNPCPACCPSVLTWHCIDSLNCFLLCTPCSTCGRRQRYLASPSPLVHASHRQWHCVSLSTTGCQFVCSCKILSNIIYLSYELITSAFSVAFNNHMIAPELSVL